MLAHPKNIESLCCFQGPVAYAHRQRSAALRAKIQATGSLREIPYPCCGDYGDYLRGFFSILSSPGSLRFHPGNRAVLQRLGSFSKLGFRAVTSHQPRASRGLQKSLPILTIIPSILTILPFLWVSTHCSCRGGLYSSSPSRPHGRPKHLQG